ncbi:hypothetical protein FQN49_001295 [Arthroderma sp. PD_2]|nr:hypothetical protein FQN49_001295 [Arthroderma sp. PD_2]
MIDNAYSQTLEIIIATHTRLEALKAILDRKPKADFMISGLDRSTLYTYETMFGVAYLGRNKDNTLPFKRLYRVLKIFSLMKDGFADHPIELWCNNEYLTKDIPKDFVYPVNFAPADIEKCYMDSRPADRGGQRVTVERSICKDGDGEASETIVGDDSPGPQAVVENIDTGTDTFDLLRVCCTPRNAVKWREQPSMSVVRATPFAIQGVHIEEFSDFLPTVLTHELSHSERLLGFRKTLDIIGRESAYGFDEVCYHADHNPKDAIKNADNIAFFAIAMYLRGYDWSTGYNEGMYKKARFGDENPPQHSNPEG